MPSSIDDAVDALGDGVEHADREAVGEATGELGRRGDRRRRRAGRVAVVVGELRAAADAARVEQPRAAAVDVAAVGVELEDPRALEEERPALAVEGLERGQIELRRIGFHLAEVGVDRRVERQVRREPDLEIGADGGLTRMIVARQAAVARRAVVARAVLHHDVRRELDATWRRQPADATQRSRLRHVAVLLAAEQRPRDALAGAGDVASDDAARRCARRPARSGSG